MRNARAILLAALLAGGLPTAALAQTNPTLTDAERGIRDDDADRASALRIASLKAEVAIAGPTADVTLELLITSSSQIPYEANLALLLPADAVVTGYALDVGGRMIPGQLLDQPKARNVYEDEVRKGIDPGLAEISGNRFTTRIFPITAAMPRRVSITFSAPFDPAKGLVLPMLRDTAIDAVSLSLKAQGYAAAPDVRFNGQSLAMARTGGDWQGSIQPGNRLLTTGLEISGGRLAEPITVTRHPNGDAFFVLADTMRDSTPANSPKTGQRLRVYWDRSVSHGDDDLARETEALLALVQATSPSAIDLVTFASDAPQVITVSDAPALRSALQAITYRGGTSLAGLETLSLPAASECVMAFDGQITIDRNAEFAPDCRLSMLTSAPDADGARLGRLAQPSGGAVVRVTTSLSATEAASRLLASANPVRSLRDGSGRRVDYRALPAAAGGWLLVGPMPADGTVELRLANGERRAYHAGVGGSGVAAPGALWASQQVQALADDPARHQAMVDFARRYRIAGPDMAFLVLERPDQYLAAEITPPAGFSDEWMAQYSAAKKDAQEERASARSERFDSVLTAWQSRKQWWKTAFVARKPDDRRRLSDNEAVDAAAEAADGAVMVSPSPSPPVPVSAPPPPPPPPSRPSAANSDIIVTSSGGGGGGGGGEEDDIIVAAQRRTSPSEQLAMPVMVTGSAAVEDRSPAPQRDAAVRIELAKTLSNQPYLAALEAAASPAERLRVLGEQQLAYGKLPGFFLDTAEWFRLKGDLATASLLLLSALELPASDDETRQIVAFRLEQMAAYDRAVELAERLAANNAGFRPQPDRGLAMALAARGKAAGRAGRADLERAFTLLTDVALKPAQRDFDGLEVIALMEANALIPAIEAAGGQWQLDPRLVGLLATDVRIVIEWTADDADIDLWVNEPNGERVWYSANLSSAGGQISNDMTDGYGPEEYAIRNAPRGAYQVRVNGYDADRINPNGAGHVLVRLIRNFGRSAEATQLVDVDLAYQAGRNRDNRENAEAVATLRVE